MSRRRRLTREELPAAALDSGHVLKLFREGPAWSVWVTDASASEGVCLGVSTIRRAALNDAIAALKGAIKELQAQAVAP